jgi:transposase
MILFHDRLDGDNNRGIGEEEGVRRTDYPHVISESIAALHEREIAVRGTPAAPRIQMLRLLKSREATTLPQVAALVGFSPRHVERWWQTDRTAGLAALEAVYHPAGKRAQLTDEAWAGLRVALEAGRIGGQEDARRYLAETWGVRYQSVNAISYQFKRRKVKWKTGRRRHARADAAAQVAFRQTSAPR